MPVRLSVDALDARLTPAVTGAADPAFAGYVASVAAGANQLNAALVQPDGKIVLAGTSDATNPANADFVVVRLNPDGTPDPTFNGTGRLVLPSFGPGSDDQATAVGRQSNGSLVVGGWTNKGAGYDLVAVRITPTGGLDTGFGTNGYAVVDAGGTDKAYALAVGADDRVVLAGSAGGTDSVAVARLSASGQLDPTFNAGKARTIQLGGQEEARGVAIYADNSILLAGWRTAAGLTDTVALRLSVDGTFTAGNFGTASFDSGTEVATFARLDAGGEDKALAATLLPDNRFVLAGYATVGAAKQLAVSRFTVSGLPDATFGTGGLTRVSLGGSDDQAAAVLVQPDGRPVLAGSTNAGGYYRAAAVRLTTAGQLDASFNQDGKATVAYGTTTGGDDRGLAVARDTQGRIVVAGRAAGSVAAARLVGGVGLPAAVTAGGPATGVGTLLGVPVGGTALDAASARPVTFFSGFAGTVRTATADVTGDGVPDLIGVAGPGAAPVLTVRDGATDRVLVQPFNAYEATFTGGLFVSAADLNGDGRADLILTPDQGGGPVVAVFDGAKLAAGIGAGAEIARFYGIQDVNFRGGARTAAGDIDGDGKPDLVVAAGFGGGPRIAVYDGRTVLAAVAGPTASGVSVPARLLANDFFAFEDSLRNGAYVTVGDLDGDGRADLFFGGGPGGGPRVRAVSGKQLLALGGIANLDAVSPAGFQLANFFAGDPAGRGGVPLAVKDIDGDDKADLVTASGQGQAARVLVFRGSNLLTNGAPTADQALDLFGGAGLPGGVYVG